MPNVALNISFDDSPLAEIDPAARREARPRSELLGEVARPYVRRRNRREALFKLGDRRTARLKPTASDLSRERRAVRSGIKI